MLVYYCYFIIVLFCYLIFYYFVILLFFYLVILISNESLNTDKPEKRSKTTCEHLITRLFLIVEGSIVFRLEFWVVLKEDVYPTMTIFHSQKSRSKFYVTKDPHLNFGLENTTSRNGYTFSFLFTSYFQMNRRN